MIKIREYQEKDKTRVIELVSRVLFEIFGVRAKNMGDLRNINKEYLKKGGVFYVAEDNGKIVGTIAVKKENDKIARLKRMYVDKDYRKQKLGQTLLTEVLQFCKRKGYTKIVSSTYSQMKTAIKFYKKTGFKEVERKGGQIFFELSIC